MPTLRDYLASPACWVSGLILAVIGGVLSIVLIRFFRRASIQAIRYLTARNEHRNKVFLSKVAHVSGSPLRFTLLAARQSSIEAVVPVYEGFALVLVYLSYGLPAGAQAGAVILAFFAMVGGIGGQLHSNYLFSILMAALEKAERSNQAMQPAAGRSDV